MAVSRAEVFGATALAGVRLFAQRPMSPRQQIDALAQFGLWQAGVFAHRHDGLDAAAGGDERVHLCLCLCRQSVPQRVIHVQIQSGERPWGAGRLRQLLVLLP